MASNWQPQAAEAMARVLTNWPPFEETDLAERERLLAAVVAKFNEFCAKNGSPAWGPGAVKCISYIVSDRLLPVKGDKSPFASMGKQARDMVYGGFCTFELVGAIRAGERLTAPTSASPPAEEEE